MYSDTTILKNALIYILETIYRKKYTSLKISHWLIFPKSTIILDILFLNGVHYCPMIIGRIAVSYIKKTETEV